MLNVKYGYKFQAATILKKLLFQSIFFFDLITINENVNIIQYSILFILLHFYSGTYFNL